MEKVKYIVSNKKKAVLSDSKFKKFWITNKLDIDYLFGKASEENEITFFGYKKKNQFDIDSVILGYTSGNSLMPESKTDSFPTFLREASNMYQVYSQYEKKGCSGIYDIDKKKLLFEGLEYVDLGNIKDHYELNEIILKCIESKIVPVTIGGNHYITKELIETISEYDNTEKVIIIYDAHQDCKYSMVKKNQINHANFVRELLEKNDVIKVVQVGVRGLRSIDTVYEHQKLINISTEKIEQLPECIKQLQNLYPNAKGYLSVDLDVVDPNYYPYVDFQIPEGISPSALVKSIDDVFITIPILGCDLVEGLPTNNYANANIPLILLVHILDGINKTKRNKEVRKNE